ncbi:3,4-dihydroxy-2-butanone-4-phosphate synthase [Dactylosporangium fulvum]|uniref:3,4-dihydroxy-2-butanone-4-phosphate synthase n=1 Tax=Dactylosporangium fulvum TaxID=53359 RepID=A0ABY5VR69_9ACTN|nr:3,4-dihydroxy-2-butanone-4-phosphate synthase [Dactylosporangium fulvum]UWP80243.1 3,4-dihydroxy-2-butanone-4-phosphate synthase [Dactylosporangium fulvum]
MLEAASRVDRGYLMLAAECATPGGVALMVRHTSGFLRVALTQDIAYRLDLPMMVVPDAHPPSRLFTVTVDASHGIDTGISAADRARTARVLASPTSAPDDLRRPGHLVPLCIAAGGVLERPGFAEAAADLARAAGLAPVAMLGEVVTDTGRLADEAVLDELCRTQGLARVSVDDVIAERRQASLAVVARYERCLAAGKCLEVLVADLRGATDHRAYVFGDLDDGRDVPVYVHRECVSGDVFGSADCACGQMLRDDLAALSAAGRGVLVYVGSARHRVGRVSDAEHQFHADMARYAAVTPPTAGPTGALSPPADSAASMVHQSATALTYGVAADVLKLIGVRGVRIHRFERSAADEVRSRGLAVAEETNQPYR